MGYTEEVTLTPASLEAAEQEPDEDAGRYGLPNGHARHSGEKEDNSPRAKRARLSVVDSGAAGHHHAENKVIMAAFSA